MSHGEGLSVLCALCGVLLIFSLPEVVRCNDDTIYEDHDKPRRRLYSVTKVLDSLREMGSTDDEIACERVMMYADIAYRRFWTSGEWIM